MNTDFSQLGIDSHFIKCLEERHIANATDIQKKVIPVLSSGKSVFFSSATGTGKTFAYLLPLLQKLKEEFSRQDVKGIRRETSILIIAPTLELCTQIKGELDFLLAETDVSCALVIGSVNLERQIENLRKNKPDIIVGNPNRLLVLAKKKIIKLNNIKALVLDEADRLVSDEMTDDTNELCQMVKRFAGGKQKNENKLVITACSATMNKKCIEKLFSILDTSDIQFIESEDNEILREKIEHWAIFSEKRRKDQTLRSLLAALKGMIKKSKVKTLIFTSKGDEAALILSKLQFHHVAAAGLFGKSGKKPVSSAERKAALDSFRKGSVDALISTDLAARGLDVAGITHVVALDVPSDSEVYIHRCGRTGRAGKRGTMITIGDETQMRLLAAMEKKLKIKVYPKELHYGEILAPDQVLEKSDE